MKMSLVSTHNANFLWNNLDKVDRFIVDDQGCLSYIPRWNVIGRVTRRIKNIRNEVTNKVLLAIEMTFDNIVRSNQNARQIANDGTRSPFQLVYVRYKEESIFNFYVDSYYSTPHYPVDELAQRIKNRNLFQVPAIQTLVDQVIAQSHFYPLNPRPPCYVGNPPMPTRRLNWDDPTFDTTSVDLVF